MQTTIRATILFAISLIGSAIVFTGGTGGIAHTTVAGNFGSAHNVSILVAGSGSGASSHGFTWG